MEYWSAVYGSLGILAIVGIPGLTISFALYPKRNALTVIERLGYAVFLGFLPYVFLYFLQKNFSVPATLTTVVGVALAATLLSLAVGYQRWHKETTSPPSTA